MGRDCAGVLLTALTQGCWQCRLQVGDTWRFSVVPRSVAELPLPRGTVRCQVTAVSRTGLQSAPTELKIKARH
jgi:hypothetical protein